MLRELLSLLVEDKSSAVLSAGTFFTLLRWGFFLLRRRTSSPSRPSLASQWASLLQAKRQLHVRDMELAFSEAQVLLLERELDRVADAATVKRLKDSISERLAELKEALEEPA